MIYDLEYLEDDWAKTRQAQDLGAEQSLRPAPKRALYFHEDTKENFLAEIERENVKQTIDRDET